MDTAEVGKTTEQVKATLTQMVARRAYEKYAGRGFQHGNDQQDWLEAEKEVLTTSNGGKPIPEGIKALNRQGKAAICPQPMTSGQ